MEQLIKNLARKLDSASIPYMIIDGQAVLVHGRARLTEDIDVTIGTDIEQYEIIEDICSDLNLKILPDDPKQFANQTLVLPTEHSSNLRVDFIFSFIEYERQAIERATIIKIDEYPVRFTSCEDLIILKMVSGRAIDTEDVKSVLVKNSNNFDNDYILNWLNEFAKNSEYKYLPQKFDLMKGDKYGNKGN